MNTKGSCCFSCRSHQIRWLLAAWQVPIAPWTARGPTVLGSRESGYRRSIGTTSLDQSLAHGEHMDGHLAHRNLWKTMIYDGLMMYWWWPFTKTSDVTSRAFCVFHHQRVMESPMALGRNHNPFIPSNLPIALLWAQWAWVNWCQLFGVHTEIG